MGKGGTIVRLGIGRRYSADMPQEGGDISCILLLKRVPKEKRNLLLLDTL